MIELYEEKKRIQKQKDTFFASVNHELRNPLNSLIGCIDIMMNSQKKEIMILETAKTCGETLLNLIGNVLDVSKIGKSFLLFY